MQQGVVSRPGGTFVEDVEDDERCDVTIVAPGYEMLTLERALPGATREALLHQIGMVDPRPPRSIDKGIPVEMTTLQGRAAPEIVAHAKKIGADLIVMGTHGRSGFQHALLGSVAERVVHHSPCPVLVVPARERGAAG